MRVLLQGLVDATGRMTNVHVMEVAWWHDGKFLPVDEASSQDFVQSAVEAVSAWRFDPAVESKRKVAVLYPARIDFGK